MHIRRIRQAKSVGLDKFVTHEVNNLQKNFKVHFIVNIGYMTENKLFVKLTIVWSNSVSFIQTLIAKQC